MSDADAFPIDVRTASSEEVAAAITRGVRRALAHHKRIGNTVVEWDRETQSIRLVPPEQIPDFPDNEPGAQTSGQISPAPERPEP
jgi:hypothetical protein